MNGRKAALAAALLLGACATVVRGHPLRGPESLPQKEWPRLARVYLVLQTAPDGDTSSQAAPDSSGFTRPWTYVELRALAHDVEKLADGPWGGVIAAQTYSGDELPAAASVFSPTASLWLEPSALRAHQEVISEQVDTRTQRAVKQYGAGIDGSLAWRLYAEPGHALLAQGRFPRRGDALAADQPAHKLPDLAAYLSDSLPRRFDAMLAPLREQLLPHPADQRSARQSAPWDLPESSTTAKSPWMSEPMTLLPFSNATAYAGAADSLRNKVYAALLQGGYSALPPGRPSVGTGTALLLSGDVARFDVVRKDGVFESRVALHLRLRDAAGSLLWEGRAATSERSLSDPRNAGRTFLQALVGDQADPNDPNFLKDQAQETVLRALGSLPQAPMKE